MGCRGVAAVLSGARDRAQVGASDVRVCRELRGTENCGGGMARSKERGRRVCYLSGLSHDPI
jgi:hypothetical protein